jgi:hypothetical protein
MLLESATDEHKHYMKAAYSRFPHFRMKTVSFLMLFCSICESGIEPGSTRMANDLDNAANQVRQQNFCFIKAEL